MVHLALTSIICLCTSSLATNEPHVTIRSCRELTLAIREKAVGQTFDLTAQVSGVRSFSLLDGGGSAVVRSFNDDLIANWPTIHRWDIVHLAGHIFCEDGDVKARGHELQVVGSGPAARPATVQHLSALLQDVTADGRYVAIAGTVDDVFRDEIDPRWTFLVLNVQGERIFVDYKISTPRPESLLGADVMIACIFHATCFSSRKFFGAHLVVDCPDDFSVLSRHADYPFSAPPLEDYTDLRPSDISALGRRRVSGRVLAVWNDSWMLLKTSESRCVRVNLSASPLPHCGAFVEAVGLPETDLFRVNLSRAVWRPSGNAADYCDAPATNLPLSELSNRHAGFINPNFHGKVIRAEGLVRDFLSDVDGRGTFMLHAEGESVFVDASAVAGATRHFGDGWRVAATGVCVVEAEEWRPNLMLPHITGLRLVMRTPQDIEILARPPWWTPARLLLVIGLLAVILVVIAIWNLSLRHLAERRSRQLAHEAIGRAESELKIYERTRLAVELHDALSQTLTGVAMEIRAAGRDLTSSIERSREHLVRAEKTVDACRGELKNCLWDLRNDAIDEADINEAIRKTLAPHIGTAALTVRFAVPRSRFSDNTAHAILHIIRELAVNAIRHGRATAIRIAGAIDGDIFRFSVRDNGTGFVPETAPGIHEGHFGIQGIRERIERFDGELKIESRPGDGTRVSIALAVPKEKTP